VGRVASRAALAAGLWLLVLVAPAGVLAADPTFERATATQAFGESINVEQQVSLPGGVQRVEAYIRSTDGSGTFLAQISNPGAGAHTLRYSDETPPGSLMPNTLVELGFRITLADGTFVDGPPVRVRYEDDRFDWRTIEGDVVRIHWYEGNQGFAQRALNIGDKAVKDAATLLGVDESLPIDFYVYADRDAFYDVIGPTFQENVGGLAIPAIRTLFANIVPSEVADPWVALVVPHELTHIVFDTATRNDYHEPPHWLDEGLADYLAIGYASDARGNVERAARTNNLMPLRALVLRFPSTAERFSLAYDESVSAIDYLVRTHGQDALVQLIQGYAGGVADDDAFQTALGVDVAGFEAGWLADLGAADPVPYGPKPAPPGPLPPGWNAAPQPTGPPVATPPPPGIDLAGDAGLGTTLVIGVGVLFAIVVVLGIFVVARGLNRGDPLLPRGAVSPQDSSPQGSSPPGTSLPLAAEPGPDEDLPTDLAALDARLAPPGPSDPGGPAASGEPAAPGEVGLPGERPARPTDPDRLGDRP
jgi:peptidase MA superfamily protein